MKSLLKLIAVAAAVRALTLVAIPTTALAGEYCLSKQYVRDEGLWVRNPATMSGFAFWDRRYLFA